MVGVFYEIFSLSLSEWSYDKRERTILWQMCLGPSWHRVMLPLMWGCHRDTRTSLTIVKLYLFLLIGTQSKKPRHLALIIIWRVVRFFPISEIWCEMWCVTREDNLGWQCQCCSLSTLPGNVSANWWYLYHLGMSPGLFLPNQRPSPQSDGEWDHFTSRFSFCGSTAKVFSQITIVLQNGPHYWKKHSTGLLATLFQPTWKWTILNSNMVGIIFLRIN